MAATEINISDFASKTQDTLSNTDNVLMCGDGSVANKTDVFSLKQALNSYNAFFGANKLKLYSGMFPLDSDFKKETFTTDSKKCATKLMATNEVQITFDDTLYNVYAYYADIAFNYTATRVINNGDFISTALPYIRIYCERKDNADITPSDVNVYIGQTKEAIRNDYFNACIKEINITDPNYSPGDKYYLAMLYKSDESGIQINITKNGTSITSDPSTDKTVCKYWLGASYFDDITPIVEIPNLYEDSGRSDINAKALIVWNNVSVVNKFASGRLGAYEIPLSCINGETYLCDAIEQNDFNTQITNAKIDVQNVILGLTLLDTRNKITSEPDYLEFDNYIYPNTQYAIRCYPIGVSTYDYYEMDNNNSPTTDVRSIDVDELGYAKLPYALNQNTTKIRILGHYNSTSGTRGNAPQTCSIYSLKPNGIETRLSNLESQ